MPLRAVLFDFDGTLADSFTAITSSTNHVRLSFGLPALSEAVVRTYVGLGLVNLMQNLVPGANADEAVERYRAHHTTVMLSETRLMPGVAETLPVLAARGIRMAVCSNKQVQFTRELVVALGLDAFFPIVLGPEDVGGRAKPDPAMLLEGMTRLAVTAPEAVYVGDMAIDVQCAKAAGMAAWLVLGGASGAESATDADPDRLFTHFSDLLPWVPQP